MARTANRNNVGKFQTSVKQYLCFSHFAGHDMAAEKWLLYKMFTQEDIYASVEIVQFDRGAWRKGTDHERLFTRTSDL